MKDRPILNLRDVTRRYDQREVVSKAGFALHSGRITCLLGPSGCGKSTILRMIAGLEPIDEGEISVHGQVVSAPGLTVAPERRGIGLVFQDNALFPHLNVRDNVGFGLQSLSANARQALVQELLARFHVEHLAQAWPHTLSGGEQQRVAIARALAREPVLLLLDEPFSGLDGHLRAHIRGSLIANLRDVGTTVLVVTHDPEEAMTIADDLILMADGRILQTGHPEECYDNPVSLTAARLLGDAISLPAQVSGETADTPFGSMSACGLPDGTATMIVRPKDVIIADRGMPANILSVRRFGRETVVEVTSDTHRFTIRTNLADLSIGQTIYLQIHPTAARVLKTNIKAATQ